MVKNQGFTLIELMVALVLSTIVIGMGISFLSFYQKSMIKAQKSQALSSKVESELYTLKEQLRKSQEVLRIDDENLLFVDKRGDTLRYNNSDSLTIRANSSGEELSRLSTKYHWRVGCQSNAVSFIAISPTTNNEKYNVVVKLYSN